MPLIYYYKLPLSAGCNGGQTASPQDKLRAQRLEDWSIPHLVSTGVLQTPQVNGVPTSVDSLIQRTDSYLRQKPAFIPEFHGFEMFVWSLRSPQVLKNVVAAASLATYSHPQVPLQSQVTWVSQMTSDRIGALQQLLLVWKGPICIAL
jgi:hypothetical protein